jgi:hypothetical protein
VLALALESCLWKVLVLLQGFATVNVTGSGGRASSLWVRNPEKHLGGWPWSGRDDNKEQRVTEWQPAHIQRVCMLRSQQVCCRRVPWGKKGWVEVQTELAGCLVHGAIGRTKGVQ